MRITTRHITLFFCFFSTLVIGFVDCETTATEQQPRPIILLIEDSNNMRAAYTSLQRGAASLFTKYQGRAQSLSFYLYRFDSNGNLQAELTNCTSGDEFVGTLQRVMKEPMPGAASCQSMCCCTSAFYTVLERLIAAHNASTFFAALDCIRAASEIGSQLAKDLNLAGSELYMFIPDDSYCAGEGISARAAQITDFAFNINMASVGDVESIAWL